MTKSKNIGNEWALHSIITFFIFICLYFVFNIFVPAHVSGNNDEVKANNSIYDWYVTGEKETINHTQSNQSNICCHYWITGISQGVKINFTVPVINGNAEIPFSDLYPKGPGWDPNLNDIVTAKLICCENATNNQTQS